MLEVLKESPDHQLNSSRNMLFCAGDKLPSVQALQHEEITMKLENESSFDFGSNGLFLPFQHSRNSAFNVVPKKRESEWNIPVFEECEANEKRQRSAISHLGTVAAALLGDMPSNNVESLLNPIYTAIARPVHTEPASTNASLKPQPAKEVKPRKPRNKKAQMAKATQNSYPFPQIPLSLQFSESSDHLKAMSFPICQASTPLKAVEPCAQQRGSFVMPPSSLMDTNTRLPLASFHIARPIISDRATREIESTKGNHSTTETKSAAEKKSTKEAKGLTSSEMVDSHSSAVARLTELRRRLPPSPPSPVNLHQVMVDDREEGEEMGPRVRSPLSLRTNGAKESASFDKSTKEAKGSTSEMVDSHSSAVARLTELRRQLTPSPFPYSVGWHQGMVNDREEEGQSSFSAGMSIPVWACLTGLAKPTPAAFYETPDLKERMNSSLEKFQPLRPCEFHPAPEYSDSPSSSILSSRAVDADIALEGLAKETLGIHVKPNARNRMKDLMHLLIQLESKNVLKLVKSKEDGGNCILGFSEIQVHELQVFNMEIRRMVLEDENRCWLVNGKTNIKEPTGPVYEILRQIGIKPMRGMRGPRKTDPGKRDFMYSYRYIFDLDLMIKNRNRLQSGYIGRSHRPDFELSPDD